MNQVVEISNFFLTTTTRCVSIVYEKRIHQEKHIRNCILIKKNIAGTTSVHKFRDQHVSYTNAQIERIIVDEKFEKGPFDSKIQKKKKGQSFLQTR